MKTAPQTGRFSSSLGRMNPPKKGRTVMSSDQDQKKAILARLRQEASQDRKSLCLRLAEYIADPFGELEVAQADYILLCIQDFGIEDVMKRLDAPAFETRQDPEVLEKDTHGRPLTPAEPKQKEGLLPFLPAAKSKRSKLMARFESHQAVRATKGVCGGRPCLGNTRLEVTLILAYWLQGVTDERLLKQYPGLEKGHLNACRDYLIQHAHDSNWPTPRPMSTYMEGALRDVVFERHLMPRPGLLKVKEDQGDDAQPETNDGGEDLSDCLGIGTMGVHTFHQGECVWCGLEDPESD